MVWSKEQKEQMINNYWENGQAHCPDDGAILKNQYQPSDGNYTLSFYCPSCKTSFSSEKKYDTLFDKFRYWTQDEKDQLKKDIFSKGYANCPIDNNSLVNTRKQVWVCRRCTNHVFVE